MQKKMDQVSKYWSHEPPKMQYSQVDARSLSPFTGTHPAVMQEWLRNEAEQHLQVDPNYRLTRRDKRLWLKQRLEQLTGLDLSRKHFKLVA